MAVSEETNADNVGDFNESAREGAKVPLSAEVRVLVPDQRVLVETGVEVALREGEPGALTSEVFGSQGRVGGRGPSQQSSYPTRPSSPPKPTGRQKQGESTDVRRARDPNTGGVSRDTGLLQWCRDGELGLLSPEEHK